MEFINLKAQYKAYESEIDSRIKGVMESAAFIMGKEVEACEKSLAQFTGSRHAISCASGTDALLLALMGLGVGVGDEVITTPFTFIATAEVIALLGAKSVFVDIKDDDYNIDASLIEAKITAKTKAIIPVSLYGQVADMDEINAVAKKHKIAVIEDGCQSFGAEYKGQKSCNLSTIGTTSFFPSKPLGCYGDGGALFTNDDELAAKIASIRNHGQAARYEHHLVGINGRFDAIQAAVVNVKLKYFGDELAKREELRVRYNELLADVDGVITPFVKSDRNTVTAQYSIRVKNREKVIKSLADQGIPTAVHYPKPLHLQKAFEDLGYKVGDFPVSELVSGEVLSLPFSQFLTHEEQDKVVSALKSAVC